MVNRALGRTLLWTSGILAVTACTPTSSRIVYTNVTAAPWTTDKAVEAAEAGTIPVNVPHTRVLVSRIDAQPGDKLPDGAARIVLPYPETDKKSGKPTQTAVVFHALTSAVPIESNRILGLAPRRAFTDRTDLKVTYLDGTLIPKSIGTESVDLVKTRIEQIGSVVTAAIPLSSALGGRRSGEPDKPTGAIPVPFEPFVFEVDEHLEPDGNPKPIPSMPKDSRWTYRVSWDINGSGAGTPDDPTAVVYETVLGRFGTGRDHGFFPSTVCRDLKLTVKYGDDDVYTAIVRVADPARVRLVPLPAKGNLNFHGVCGVDLVDGTRAEPDRLGALEALFKQATLIKAAMKPKTP